MQMLSGVFCAFWTATDPKGEVLWSEFDRHLKWILASGVQGIMALGSTGEFPHLTVEQRKAIVERIQRHTASDQSVIANVSHVSHRTAIELALHAKGLGAIAAAVLPPWFYPMHPRDLVEFFMRIGGESGLPLLLYNFPEVSGKKIELETIAAVAQRTPVLAVKQSGGEFGYHAELLALGKELGFSVLTGADTRLEEALRLGCTGTVSGLANAVPASLVDIYKNSCASVASPKETRFVSEVARCMQPLEFPLNVKAVIEARGFESGSPKNPVSSETAVIYERVRKELAALFGNPAV